MSKAMKTVLGICAACLLMAGALLMQPNPPISLAAGTFADRDAVVIWIGENPSQMADLLEEHLAQGQLDFLENLTAPAAASAEKELSELKRGLVRLKKLGITTATIIDPIETRIADLENP